MSWFTRNAQFSFGIEPNKLSIFTGRSLVDGSEEAESNTVNPAVAQAIAGIPIDHVIIRLIK